MKKSLLKILSVIFSCLFVLSCSNLISGDNSGAGYNSFEKVNIRGTIGVKGALPASIANARSTSAINAGRTAIPSLPEESEYYFFKTRDLDSGEVDNAAGYAESDGSYSVGLVIGRRYEVTAGISSDTEHENVILSTSWETPLVTRENASSLGKNIILEPESEGTGTVSLLIKVSASNISSVIDCSNDKFKLTHKEGSTNEYYLSQNGENIQCGSYEVTLKFYDETTNTCLYFNTQTINVFPDLQTGKWRSGGGSLDPIDASGSYNVTNELVEKFARSQIYVGTTSWGNASVNGSGSPKSPFVSLQNAVSYIARMNDSTIDYTIWISGEVSGNSTIDSDVNGKAHSITVSGTRGNDRDSLNGNNSGSVLTISTSVPVTIKNILITGGRASYGGGINMDSGTNVILESDALIDGNYASDSGGGIYSKGTLVLKSGSIVGRQVSSTATNSSYSNYATTGGGISFAGGTVTLEKDSVVSYNFAYQGGGIQCSFSSYSASYVLSITSAEIAYNGCDPKIRFSRDCSWSSYGGGIFANGCKFAASAIKLHDNYGSDGGGGLFLQNCSSGEMTDCSVFDNTMHASGYSEATDVLLFDACRLSLKDCQVSNKNKVSNGVKVRTSTSYLELKGSTVISSKTPVLLNSGTYITVSDNLTGTSPVATINMETWSQGPSAIVVMADGTKVKDLSTISDITNMFVCSEEKYSTVLSDDKKSLYLDAPIFVSSTVIDSTAKLGSKKNPCQSISSAATLLTDTNADYRIVIDGEITGKDNTIPSTISAKSLSIKGLTDNEHDILNGAPTDTSVLTIKSVVPITIENLTITGGNSSKTGAGIYIYINDDNKGGNITIGKNVIIENNTTADTGGGIAIYDVNKHTTTLKITENAIVRNNTSLQENYGGGGIYSSSAKIYISGSVQITDNKAGNDDYPNCDGAGIYCYSNTDDYVCLCIGYSDEEVIDTKCKAVISNNQAKGNGGGIYVAGTTLKIAGGTISENTADEEGGGVYYKADKAFFITSKTYIPAGSDNKNLVYLATGTEPGAPITIKDTLNPPYEANGIVATLKPQDYNTAIIKADTEANLQKAVGKFRIIQKAGSTSLGTGLEYGLDSEGKYSTEKINIVTASVASNKMNEICTSINSLISGSQTSYNLWLIGTLKPIANGENYSLTIPAGKEVSLSAPDTANIRTFYTSDNYVCFFNVEGKLTLGNNISIQGNKSSNTKANTKAFKLNNGSQLILDGAKITDCGTTAAALTGGFIAHVVAGSVLRIKGNTDISYNTDSIYVDGGTVYMEGGKIHDNDLGSKDTAVIIMQNKGNFIKSGGEISGNKGYRGRQDGKPSQVSFNTTGGGGYWGTTESNLKLICPPTGKTYYFTSKNDVESQTVSERDDF